MSGGEHFSEHPVLFGAGDAELFGVLTRPAGRVDRGVGVVVAVGGAYIPAPNRNRLSVHLARRLAPEGFHVLRFDYHGVGESTGAIDGYWLDRPFVADLEGAVRVLEGAGVGRIVLVGSCFGARTVLAAAERVSGLAGVVLISVPLRDFQMGDNRASQLAQELTILQLLRRALRPRVLRNLLSPQDRRKYVRSKHLYSRTVTLKARLLMRRLLSGAGAGDGRGSRLSPGFLAQFRRLARRGVPTLLLYGRDESFYEEFMGAAGGPVRGLADGGACTVDVVDGVVHGFTSLAIQETVLGRVEAWIRALDAVPASGSPRQDDPNGRPRIAASS